MTAWLILLVSLIAACTSEGELRQRGSKNREVVVDGSLVVPQELDYRWRFLSKPEESRARLADATTPFPRFFADKSGEYRLQASLGVGASRARPAIVVVEVNNNPPFAVATDPNYVPAGRQYELDATASSDIDSDPLSFSWRVVEAPETESVEFLGEGVSPAVIISGPGQYVLAVDVSDGEETTTDIISFVGTPHVIRPLQGNFDADYSEQLDKIVLAIKPSTVEVFDMNEQLGEMVLVNQVGVVSVSDDGLMAAVGSTTRVVLVDLRTTMIVDSFEIGYQPSSLSLRDGAAIFASSNSSGRPITRIDVATGSIETTITSEVGHVRIAPTEDVLYANNGRFSKWTTAAPITQLRLQATTEDHGARFWFSEDGERMFSETGLVVRANDDPNLDMTGLGALQTGEPLSHVSESEESGIVAASRLDEEFVIFDATTFAHIADIPTPLMPVGNGNDATRLNATHVFLTDDGTRYRVILEGPHIGYGNVADELASKARAGSVSGRSRRAFRSRSARSRSASP